ncbi:mycofactocin-coupled SDR family oxidoreductase [Aeromicrobium panaciterrae]|uniref:mycofactocin-coupled SDR family oxidoreductase n=1 Tax=Aeromicrobium panaciterrae TaxID=363861 RepID=UPI0031D4D9E4
MDRMSGKVALITGAARGQGRSHAVRLAEEGADVVAVDVLADNDALAYALATEEDMEETQRQVEATGRRFVACRGDVRSQDDLDAAVIAGVETLGHIDTVCLNAGVSGRKVPTWELDTDEFDKMIQINLLGAQRTVKAVVPHMIESGRGGSIVFINSTLGLKGIANLSAYTASKHGLLGLARVLAGELAPHNIRVNSVHPTGVGTDLILNEATWKTFRPDLENPTLDDAKEAFTALHQLPVAWVETVDVANAVLFLASDEARYITGISLPVDAGNLNR